jgi:hypothetical protein
MRVMPVITKISSNGISPEGGELTISGYGFSKVLDRNEVLVAG